MANGVRSRNRVRKEQEQLDDANRVLGKPVFYPQQTNTYHLYYAFFFPTATGPRQAKARAGEVVRC